MSKKDIVTTSYISVNERFADAVNVGIFHGKHIVSPKQIQKIDTVSKIVLESRENSKKDYQQSYRDVVKRIIYDTNFCIIGVENQSEVHYVFPVRNMLYDAVSYKKQWDAIQKVHREKRDLRGAEFLSGFSKTDYLRPVVTLIVYYGTEPWDAAKDIHDLINWSGMPKELKEIVPNYSVHLLDLSTYENPEDFQSDLKTVCRFLRNSKDDKKLEQMLAEYPEEFENMQEDTFDLIGTLGNMTQLKKIKSKCKKEDGGYDMCKGMEDWLQRRENEGLERGRNEGLERGRSEGLERGRSEGLEQGRSEGLERGRNETIKALIETCQELGAAKENIIAKMKEKLELNQEEAESYLQKYWKKSES